jgi:hypothetical protein
MKSSLRLLCVLCVSAVKDSGAVSTAETERTQRKRREFLRSHEDAEESQRKTKLISNGIEKLTAFQ